ncbi:uncharacterized protein M6B38_284255 [Iris pallida]|uniref:Maternal effect embryo arrest 22 n=1 Tax=Iris pallida TaxID=29817 RepID=A0AAX6I2I2_IRIPA|nr:uncharacterized protein M6B38_284255 [Iris pallida]
MAADAALVTDCSNPGCVETRKRFLKMKQSRDCSRQAVKILEEQFNKVMEEKAVLEKAHKEQQLRGKQENEAMDRESSIRQKLEKEIHDLKVEISSYRKSECLKSVDEKEIQLLKGRILEAEEETNKLKCLLEKEKKKSDSEMKKSALEKKKAAEARELVKVEKNKAEEERRLAEIEKKKAEECRISLENFEREANVVREKLTAELSKAEEARKKVEAEKWKTIREKKRADGETVKAEGQKRLLEVEMKKAVEEKARADHLSQMLEEEKQRREDLQKKIEVGVSMAKVQCSSCTGSERFNGVDANVKLLRQRLKLERKQVKHAKRVAKLEKTEKRLIMQELHLLKHSFMETFCRFNMLNNHLLHNIEGTDGETKIGKSSGLEGFKMCDKLLTSKKGNHNSKIDCGLTGTCCTGSLNYTESLGHVSLPLSRGCCTRPTTGTTSELKSPVGGSVKNKSQSSAVCSNTTSFSDEKSMGSQERGFIAVTTSAKLKKFPNQRSSVPKLLCEVSKVKTDKATRVLANNGDKNGQMKVQNTGLITSTHDAMEVADCVSDKLKCSNQRLTVSNLPYEVAKVRKDKVTGFVGKNTDKSGQVEVQNTCLVTSTHDTKKDADPESLRSLKKRKIQGRMKPVAWTSTKDNQMHLGTELPLLKSSYGSLSAVKSSSLKGISEDFVSRIGFLNEMHDDLSRNTLPKEQKRPALQCLDESGNQEQTDKFDSRRSRSVLAETALPSHQVRGNVCIEEPVNALSNERADLLRFENMIGGNCMKLLDLDNVVDEERYRRAVKMPLSPSLPHIELPSHQLYSEDESRFFVGREHSMPCHLFDVMDLEVCCNSSKLKTSSVACGLLSCGKQDFACQMEVPPTGCLNALDNDVRTDDRLQNPGLNTPLPGSSISLDTKQTQFVDMSNNEMNDIDMVSSIMGVGVHQQTKPLVSCLVPKTFPKLKTVVTPVAAETNRTLLLGNGAVSHSIHEDGCSHSSTQDICNLVTSISSVATGENKICGRSDITNLDLIESQVETEGKSPASSLLTEARKFTNCDNKSSSAGRAEPSAIGHLSEGSSISSSLNIEKSSATAEVMDSIPPYVVFSKAREEDSMSRVLCLKNKFTYQNFMVSHTDRVLVEVLNALSTETTLLPEEKVSVLFSMLLSNISSRITTASKCTMDDDFFSCLECFALEINKAMSDGKTRSLFHETCQLDILVSLIEDFIIEREVLMCTDTLYETPGSVDSSSNLFQIEGGKISILPRAATVHQYVAGCVILASISAAVDQIGILLEASYKILRTCKDDMSLTLLALHVFASVCRKKLLDMNEYNMLIAAIKSMVSLLEGGDEAASSISPCLRSSSNLAHSFPPCKECPFAKGAICMDKLTDLLLEVLQSYCMTGAGNPNVYESIALSVCTDSTCSVRDEQSTECRSDFDSLIGCDEVRCVFNSRKHVADLPHCLSSSPLCRFTDIVSLVELVACYMSWEWTYKRIVLRLSKMLGSCQYGELLAALFVLIGQLGRFGIDIGGYQQTGIAELRQSLAVALDTCIMKERSFPTQLAAVSALLNLLPLNFADVVGGHNVPSLDTSQSGHSKQIKKWFSELSRQQQSLSRTCLEMMIDLQVKK